MDAPGQCTCLSSLSTAPLAWTGQSVAISLVPRLVGWLFEEPEVEHELELEVARTPTGVLLLNPRLAFLKSARTCAVADWRRGHRPFLQQSPNVGPTALVE